MSKSSRYVDHSRVLQVVKAQAHRMICHIKKLLYNNIRAHSGSVLKEPIEKSVKYIVCNTVGNIMLSGIF